MMLDVYLVIINDKFYYAKKQRKMENAIDGVSYEGAVIRFELLASAAAADMTHTHTEHTHR